jgi:KUP system potassium uptake protein
MSTTTESLAGPSDEPPADGHGSPDRWKLLALAALGVVFGDIGTSPLYAMRECFHGEFHLEVNEVNVLGVLSLIFWALTIIVSIKYVIFILRADNHGEGGILALATLISPPGKAAPKRALVIALGLFGASFLYADGMITPAISVLSAVEGLELTSDFFANQNIVDSIAIAILIGLFMLQSRGTAGVGALFGPTMLVWFALLAVMGACHLWQMPSVLRALSPYYAWEFFHINQFEGFKVLGAVFLVVTGGEALYADIGHFGMRPIRAAWFVVVLPALLINYMGQGALLLRHPTASVNPFYSMASGWTLYPVIVLATLAAIMASQAVITGAFSLTLQAIQLGFCPRLRIEHTSSEQKGQIYIPAVNWVLMISTIVLVLGFRSSSNLAAAYGVAITITMCITTILFYLLIKERWGWNPYLAGILAAVFLGIDLSFLGANLLKIFHGGWFPILVAGFVFLSLKTWRDGRTLLAERLRASTLSTELFLADLLSEPPPRVPGTAVFMTGNPMGTPLALRQNVAHNHILHERVLILGVHTAEVPHVTADQRLEAEEIGEGFYRATLNYGFMEEPNVPRDLAAGSLALDFEPDTISYFLGRETLLATPDPGMFMWRESLFSFMSRNSQPATLFFRLPAERVVEIGAQVRL